MIQTRTSHPIKRGELEELLRSRVVVCDGAMGTMLHAAGVSLDLALPGLNVVRPELVASIHGAYIEAGCDMIETNTFGASHFRLRQYGLDDRVAEINIAGARLAREAAAAANANVLVAGSVSPVTPTGSHGRLGDSAIRGAFKEQITALVEGGIDVLLLETFGNLDEIVLAIDVAREIASDLPVVAQLTFMEDGRTYAGETPAEVAARVGGTGISALGANCTLGPQGLLDVLRELAKHTDLPLTAQPNAGSPHYVAGHFEYSAGPDYFARYAKHYTEIGAALVGGCCGTTPDHVQAVAAALDGTKPIVQTNRASRTASTFATATEEPAVATSNLVESIKAGRFALTGELAPAVGAAADRAVLDAQVLKDAGFAAVLVGPGRSQRAQVSPVSLAALIEQRVAGLEAILVVETWEKSVMSLQADLLGAHAFGVRHILCRTGTPPMVGDYTNPGGIWDVDASGLAALLREMNAGRDHHGIPLAQPTSFVTAARVNVTAEDQQREIDDARRKIAAGIDLLFTAPVYDVEALQRFLATLGDTKLPPVIMGVAPLRDFDHAEYLQEEVPDMTIPTAVLERMRLARGDGPTVGVAIARDIISRARERGAVQGVVLTGEAGDAASLSSLVSELPVL